MGGFFSAFNASSTTSESDSYGAFTGSSAISAGAGAIPVIGSIVGLVAGIFGAHHAAAVKNEAAGMNTVIPEVRTSFNNIVTGVNNGTITVQQANSYLDQIWPQYEDVVYKQFKIKKKDCNGPCVFEKQLKRDAENIKALLNSGKAGSVTISAINPGRGYQNFPAYLLTYNGPASVAGSLESLLGISSVTAATNMGGIPAGDVVIGNLAVPLWILLAIGGLLLFFGLSHGK